MEVPVIERRLSILILIYLWAALLEDTLLFLMSWLAPAWSSILPPQDRAPNIALQTGRRCSNGPKVGVTLIDLLARVSV